MAKSRFRYLPSSILYPRPLLHPSEGAAAATADAPAVATSLAALLTRHVLRDGELVILLLKPSLWFIPLSSLRFAAAVLILMAGVKVFDDYLPAMNALAVIEAGVFALAARVMWAILQWTSRLYVLTDMRIVRISGVFNVNVFDCPLRKIARTRLLFSTRERLLRLGSIEIIPLAEECPDTIWQTIARPREVHEQIIAAINKARQCGGIT